MKKKISIFVSILIIVISSIMIVSSIYYSQRFKQPIEQVKEIGDIAIRNIEYGLLLFFVICIPITNTGIQIKIKLKKMGKMIQIYPIKAVVKYRIFYSIIIILVSIVIMIDKLKLDEYITDRLETTSISENLEKEE
jgi:hypothetical protein